MKLVIKLWCGECLSKMILDLDALPSIHEVMVYKCESCLKKTIVEKIKGDEKKDGV